MKKALALILCLVMLLGVFPMNAAFAEGETKKTVSESGKEETVEISKEDEESSKEPEETPGVDFESSKEEPIPEAEKEEDEFSKEPEETSDQEFGSGRLDDDSAEETSNLKILSFSNYGCEFFAPQTLILYSIYNSNGFGGTQYTIAKGTKCWIQTINLNNPDYTKKFVYVKFNDPNNQGHSRYGYIRATALLGNYPYISGPFTSKGQANTYQNSDGATRYGTIVPNDTYYTFDAVSGYTHVIYNVEGIANITHKLAWIKTSELSWLQNGPLPNPQLISFSSPGCEFIAPKNLDFYSTYNQYSGLFSDKYSPQITLGTACRITKITQRYILAYYPTSGKTGYIKTSDLLGNNPPTPTRYTSHTSDGAVATIYKKSDGITQYGEIGNNKYFYTLDSSGDYTRVIANTSTSATASYKMGWICNAELQWIRNNSSSNPQLKCFASYGCEFVAPNNLTMYAGSSSAALAGNSYTIPNNTKCWIQAITRQFILVKFNDPNNFGHARFGCIRTSDLLGNSPSISSAYTSKGEATVYQKSNGATEYNRIGVGTTFYTLGNYNGYTRVIYNVSNLSNATHRFGWIRTAELDGLINGNPIDNPTIIDFSKDFSNGRCEFIAPSNLDFYSTYNQYSGLLSGKYSQQITSGKACRITTITKLYILAYYPTTDKTGYIKTSDLLGYSPTSFETVTSKGSAKTYKAKDGKTEYGLITADGTLYKISDVSGYTCLIHPVTGTSGITHKMGWIKTEYFNRLKTCPFKDLRVDKYYYDAVLWAKANSLTAGTGEGNFGVGTDVKRKEAVSFVWRIMGSPEPEGTENPFTDVTTGKSYYKAVLWAYNHRPQVVSATNDGKFCGSDSCSRGELMYYMWAAMGKPSPNGSYNPFADVKSTDWYYNAVLWAYHRTFSINGQIIRTVSGTDDTLFSPNVTCKREDFMVVLWNLARRNNIGNNGLIPERSTPVLNITVNGCTKTVSFDGNPHTYVGELSFICTDSGYNSSKIDISKYSESERTIADKTNVGSYTKALVDKCQYTDTDYKVNWILGSPITLVIDGSQPVSADGYPELSEDAYCGFYAPCDISVYSSSTCSGTPIDTLYTDSYNYAYSITTSYIEVSYLSSGIWRTGFIRRDSIISTSIPIETFSAKTDVRVYKTHGGTYYAGFVKTGSKVYGLTPYNNDYVQVIFENKMDKQAYTLGWIKKAEYVQAKSSSDPLPGESQWLYFDSFSNLSKTKLDANTFAVQGIINNINSDFFNMGDWEEVLHEGKEYYVFPTKDDFGNEMTKCCIRKSLFRKNNNPICTPINTELNNEAGSKNDKIQCYIGTVTRSESSGYVPRGDDSLYWTESEHWTYFLVVQQSWKTNGSELIIKTKILGSALISVYDCYNTDTNEIFWDYILMTKKNIDNVVIHPKYTVAVNGVAQSDLSNWWINANNKLYISDYQWRTDDPEQELASGATAKDYIDFGIVVYDTAKELWTFADKALTDGWVNAVVSEGYKALKALYKALSTEYKCLEGNNNPDPDATWEEKAYSEITVSFHDGGITDPAENGSYYMTTITAASPLDLRTPKAYARCILDFSKSFSKSEITINVDADVNFVF